MARTAGGKLKAMLSFGISMMLAFLWYVGFPYIFEFSLFVIGLSVYEYDVPHAFLKREAELILGERHTRALRLLSAMFCVFTVVGGALLLESMKLVAQSLAEGIDLMAAYNSVILQATTLIAGPLIAMAAYVLSLARNRNSHDRELIEGLCFGDVTLLIFASFYGLCGQTIVTVTVTAAGILYALLALTKVRKPKQLIDAALDTKKRMDTLKKTIWTRWLEVGKTPHAVPLAALLIVVMFLFATTVPFIDYRDPCQLIFTSLLLLSLLVAYIGLTKQNKLWRYSAVGSGLLVLAMTMTYVEPGTMPLIGFLFSTAEKHLGEVPQPLYNIGLWWVHTITPFLFGVIASAFPRAVAGQARLDKNVPRFWRFSLYSSVALSAGAFVTFFEGLLTSTADLAVAALLSFTIAALAFVVLSYSARVDIRSMLKEERERGVEQSPAQS